MGNLQDALLVQPTTFDAPTRMPLLFKCVGWDIGNDRVFIYGLSGGCLYCGYFSRAESSEFFASWF